MKKITSAVFLWILLAIVPSQAMAAVSIHVSIPLPPPILFTLPPVVVAIPDTDSVYAAPDIDVDLFFWNGWWWRPWDGRWYRSRDYDHGWAFYSSTPTFYVHVFPGWRGNFKKRTWHGHIWNYEKIPYHRLHANWYKWHTDRHWEVKRKWNVHKYNPRARLSAKAALKPAPRREAPKVRQNYKTKPRTIQKPQVVNNGQNPKARLQKPPTGRASKFAEKRRS